jgi:uncharacterized membrane protein YbaN (DUF454 family)
MSGRAKGAAIAMITLGLGATLVWGVRTAWLRIALAALGLALIGYLLSLRRRP